MSISAVRMKTLEGRKGLIVGIANDQSISWGCARARSAPLEPNSRLPT